MTDSNHWQDGAGQRDLESRRGLNRGLNNDTLDHELHAVLKKFAAVEPRAGLEDRILANLRAERERAPERSWWRWPAVAALAAVIVVALSLAWKSGKPSQNITTQHQPSTTQTNRDDGTQVAKNGGSSAIQPHHAGYGRRLRPHAVIHPTTIVASVPKLDQFPSPQPLSEQEAILASYVIKYPEHAALIAQARAQELRQDRAEDTGVLDSDEGSQQINK